MTELVVTRGIPASGKTTFARAWVAEGPMRARVSRDDLRAQLFGAAGAAYQPYFTHPSYRDREKAVTQAEEGAASRLLGDGWSVVVDATHVRSAYVRRWEAVARRHGAELSVVLMGATLEECLERDRRREWPVGDAVVRDMAARLRNSLRSEAIDEAADEVHRWPDVYAPNESLPPAWIFDVDGTLALMDGRSPYDTSRYREDLLCEPVAALAHALDAWGHAVVVMSGRDEEFRPQTTEWLAEHGVPHDALVMRPRGDRRNDSVVKAELFWTRVAPRWRVLGAVDDRDRVVEMWRGLGIRCLQAAPGDF